MEEKKTIQLEKKREMGNLSTFVVVDSAAAYWAVASRTLNGGRQFTLHFPQRVPKTRREKERKKENGKREQCRTIELQWAPHLAGPICFPGAVVLDGKDRQKEGKKKIGDLNGELGCCLNLFRPRQRK